jgi:predicted negative regulator of RcsB-dependent stress response
VGKNKLTRKEIIGDDPVHDAIIRAAEFLSENSGKIIGLVVLIVIVAIGSFIGIRYLDSREYAAQEQLARGIDFFHGNISADATEDPYGQGPVPVFRSETEKYMAAAAKFEPVASGFAYGNISVIARYYLGLSQLRLMEEAEATANLEKVAVNSRNRTVGFLAKKVLARVYADSGENERAGELLSGMLNDPQCDLPKDEISIQLSRVLVDQGRHDEAVKVLEDASGQGLAFGIFRERLVMELERIQSTRSAGTVQSVQP